MRSGNYKQGIGWLCQDDEVDGKTVQRWCCLGVLCDQMDDVEMLGAPVWYAKDKVTGGRDGWNVPHEVADRIGLDADAQRTLQMMNDEGSYASATVSATSAMRTSRTTV